MVVVDFAYRTHMCKIEILIELNLVGNNYRKKRNNKNICGKKDK